MDRSKKLFKVECPSDEYINGIKIPSMYYPSMLWMLEQITDDYDESIIKVDDTLINTMLTRLEHLHGRMGDPLMDATYDVWIECIKTKGWTREPGWQIKEIEEAGWQLKRD